MPQYILLAKRPFNCCLRSHSGFSHFWKTAGTNRQRFGGAPPPRQQAAWLHANAGTDDMRRPYENENKSKQQDQAYCVDLVRERDGEAYLCGLLMPGGATRDAFFALRAFNVEIASIKDGHNLRNRGTATPDQVSAAAASVGTPTFALQLRMQWWRNAIAAIYNDEAVGNGNISNHATESSSTSTNSTSSSTLISSLSTSCWNSPVVRALDRAHESTKWTRRFLERMLDAREQDLDIRQYATLDDCLVYAEDTVSSLLYLTLETLHVRQDGADEVASLAGKGIGLATLLRATPYRLLHGGEMALPAQLFAADFPYHQLLPTYLGEQPEHDSMVLSESDARQLHEAVHYVAQAASQHLSMARAIQSQVPSPGGKSALLPVIPALSYLSKLEGANYNLFAVSHQTSPADRLFLLLRLTRTWATGVF